MRVAPVKIGSDNPDNLYQNSALVGEAEYRVVGQRGTVNYLGFGTQTGQYGKAGGLKTVDYVEANDMAVNADGSFEIVLSQARPEGAANWLRTLPGQGLFIVRQTFLDRESEEPAALTVERVGAGAVPPPLTCEQLDNGLASAGLFAAGAPLLFAKWARDFQRHPNQLPLFDQATSNNAGGDPGIRYYHSYWRLARGEALVIDAVPPPCEHGNFQVNNYWMESLDYRYHDVHTNKHLANYFPGGAVRIVLCHEPPAAAEVRRRLGDEAYEAGGKHWTWLTTADHDCGTMCFRWVKPGVDDEALPHPRTQVMPVAELLAR